MSLLSLRLVIVLIATVSLSSIAPSVVEAGTTTPVVQEEGDGPPAPVSYNGTNGGAETLSLQAFPSVLPVISAGDGFSGVYDFTISGATPGGLGLVVSSLAPGNTNSFGLSFLISIAPVNIVAFAYFGYGFGGDLFIPGVSQSVPALAGNVVYIQAYETGPVARTSNGIAFPLTF